MNKSPLNYLITLAIGAVLWVVSAVIVGNVLSESITLATIGVEEFLAFYRIVLAVAAFIGVSNSFYWYFYGSKDSTAGELDRAKKIWNQSFIGQISVAAGIVSVFGFKFLKEGIVLKDYLIIFGLASLHTYIFFWLCTFLMSPINVERIPLFKR